MTGHIYSFTGAKLKRNTLVSVAVLVSVCFSLSEQKASAWPAVITQPKAEPVKEQVKSESKLTRGIQKTLAEGHYRVGLRLKKKKQWEEALTQFLEATNKNPNHFKSFFEQALIYRQKQLHDMAVTCLQQALTIKPKYKDARVLLATLQLERGNVGSAFEQLKESLGIKPNVETSKNDDENSVKDSDTILQTIHTFIEVTNLVASVLASPAVQDSKTEVSVQSRVSSDMSVRQNSRSQVQVTANTNTSSSANAETVASNSSSTHGEPIKESAPILVAQEPQMATKNKEQEINHSNQVSKIKSVNSKTTVAKVTKVGKEPKIKEDEWTRKLRFLAKNGTGSLKNGEAFLFSEESGEAILILSDGTRIVRAVETPKDQETIVQMRRPDMLVPDDLLYNLSLLGKVVADSVTPQNNPGNLKKDNTQNNYQSSITTNPNPNSDSNTSTNLDSSSSSPPSFKLESASGDNFVENLEPKKMVHWLKDVLHL